MVPNGSDLIFREFLIDGRPNECPKTCIFVLQIFFGEIYINSIKEGAGGSFFKRLLAI